MTRGGIIARLAPAALALGAIGAAACDATAPSTREITLDLCDDAAWVAYQNDGGRWQHLGAGRASYRIRVTDRLAFVRMYFSPSVTSAYSIVDWVTADQLPAIVGCSDPATATGTISGRLTGLTDAHWATVFYGGSAVHVVDGASAWQMSARTAPATLAAIRYDSTFPQSLRGADRVILRRDQSFVPGTPVSPMDFTSDEAFAAEQHTVSFTGPSAGVRSAVVIGGYTLDLSYAALLPTTSGEPARSASIVTLPEARLAAGDLHVMTIETADRFAWHYARAPGDHAMSLGPPLVSAVATTLATALYRRVRVELPSQPEYAAWVSLTVSQHRQDGYSMVNMRATREYFGGTPAVWSLTIPDFSAATRFPAAAMPREGDVFWSASASNRHSGHTPRNASDGETVLIAYRTEPR